MTHSADITLVGQDETRSYFSDGSSYPRIRGGSGGQGSSDAQGATVAALQGAEAQQGAEGNGSSQGQEAQPDQGVQGLAAGFLDMVDPAHRAIVEPYVKKWDAGVTRRFQDLHGQLQPYSELGDPQMLAQAKQLYEMVDTNPQQVLKILQEALGEQIEDPNGEGGDPQAGEAPGLPPEVSQQLETMQAVLEQLAQRVLDQDTSVQEEQEDAQLEQYFELLEQEFGDFDEDYVVAKMLAGMSGEDAVKAYVDTIQGQVNTRARQPQVPPIIGGGGTVPQEGQSVTKAGRGDVKALVANILAQANQG